MGGAGAVEVGQFTFSEEGALATTPFEYFAGRRNMACVQLLERNEDVNEFVRAVLEHLVDYANHEGIRVEDVKLDRPYVTNDGYIKARITR